MAPHLELQGRHLRGRLSWVTGLSVGAFALMLVSPAVAQVGTPVGAGCGLDGPTPSSSKPTVTLPSTITLRSSGNVAIHLRGANQTAGAVVRIFQRGGKSLGGTPTGAYTCTEATRASTVGVPLTSDARRYVRRHGSDRVTLRFQLVNGSGVTDTVRRTVTLRHAA